MTEKTPDTVTELLDAQEGVEEEYVLTKDDKKVRKILKKVMAESPVVGLGVTKCVLRRLEQLHTEIMSEKVESGDAKEAALWMRDVTVLRQVITMMDDIVL